MHDPQVPQRVHAAVDLRALLALGSVVVCSCPPLGGRAQRTTLENHCHRPGHAAQGHSEGARARAARPTRSSMSGKGLKAGTATRMNKTEAPHSAPSKSRAKRSLGFMTARLLSLRFRSSEPCPSSRHYRTAHLARPVASLDRLGRRAEAPPVLGTYPTGVAAGGVADDPGGRRR